MTRRVERVEVKSIGSMEILDKKIQSGFVTASAEKGPAPRGRRVISAAFGERTALIGYLMAGFPSIQGSMECVSATIEAGADIIELGVPFSDPVADGKVIQSAGEKALANGMTLSKALEMVSQLRRKFSTPILLMSYLNPIYKYGIDRFVADAVGLGVDGAIIPDFIPLSPSEPEEASSVKFPKRDEFALVYLAASNSSDARLRTIAEASSGFIYALGLAGITGERDHVQSSVAPFVERLRAAEQTVRHGARKPIAVGFGVSKREHFESLGRIVDGVIVGSALVRRSATSPDEVGKFVKELRGITKGSSS